MESDNTNQEKVEVIKSSDIVVIKEKEKEKEEEKEEESNNKQKKSEYIESDTNESLFESKLVIKQRAEALKNFFEGKTPPSKVSQREGRGGTMLNYVSGSYMMRQFSLITNFRWSHKVIGRTFRPNEADPKEIITYVEVIYWDSKGKEYSHPATGTQDVNRWASDGKGHKQGEIISLGDDIKASETDGIKKALSYCGVASDVYGREQRNLLAEESEDENNIEEFENGGSAENNNTRKNIHIDTDHYKSFGQWLERNHIRWSQAYEILGITDNHINDYKEAFQKIKAWFKKEKDIELVN